MCISDSLKDYISAIQGQEDINLKWNICMNSNENWNIKIPIIAGEYMDVPIDGSMIECRIMNIEFKELGEVVLVIPDGIDGINNIYKVQAPNSREILEYTGCDLIAF